MTNGPLALLVRGFVWIATECNVFTMPLAAGSARASIWDGMLAGVDRIW